jgi:hypothetical protein
MMACIAFGDDSAMIFGLTAGTVVPAANTVIRMKSEDVRYENGLFETDFKFANTTPTGQTVVLGFPVFGNVERAGKTRFEDEATMTEAQKKAKIDQLFDFQCSIDGTIVARELATVDPNSSNAKYKYYYVTEVHFKPNETKDVSNSFKYIPEVWTDSIANRAYTVEYVLETGSLWKDAIGQATIQIAIPSSRESYYFFDRAFNGRFRRFSVEATPLGYDSIVSDGHLEIAWKFNEIEPNFNIKVKYGWQDFYTQGIDNIAISRFVLVDLYNSIILGQKVGATDLFKDFYSSLSKSFFSESYVPAIVEHLKELSANAASAEDTNAIVPLTRFAINAIYALEGYTFSSREWNGLFKGFAWYRGMTTNPVFDAREQSLLAELKAIRGDQ